MAEQIETPVSRRLSSVKNILIVLSGKGGVGKSSSSVQLALSLLNTSPTARVGLLDLDLTGPSLPRMVGLDLPGASVHQSSAGWVPVYVDQGRRLGVMSIGFLLKDRGDSVVWRGPKKDGMIRQFLSEVRWGELDYLVIDTPPGRPNYLKCNLSSSQGRNLGRTYITHDPSPPTLQSNRRKTNNTFLSPYHNTPKDSSERYRKIPIIHQETRPTRPRSGRKHVRLRMPLLWGDFRLFRKRWRGRYGQSQSHQFLGQGAN